MVDHALEAVLGDDDGDAEVVDEAVQCGEYVLSRNGIQGRGGFVQDEDAWSGCEHGPDGDPLLLAPGEVAQRTAPDVGEAEQVERLLHPSAHRGRVDSEGFHPVGDLLLDRVGDERGGGVLHHEPDEVGEVARAVAAGVASVDADPAVQGATGEVRDETVDAAQQR